MSGAGKSSGKGPARWKMGEKLRKWSWRKKVAMQAALADDLRREQEHRRSIGYSTSDDEFEKTQIETDGDEISSSDDETDEEEDGGSDGVTESKMCSPMEADCGYNIDKMDLHVRDVMDYDLMHFFERHCKEVSGFLVKAFNAHDYPPRGTISPRAIQTSIIEMNPPKQPDSVTDAQLESFWNGGTRTAFTNSKKTEHPVETAIAHVFALWKIAHFIGGKYAASLPMWQAEHRRICSWIAECPNIHKLGSARTTKLEALVLMIPLIHK
jgi:hypothetical protein